MNKLDNLTTHGKTNHIKPLKVYRKNWIANSEVLHA